MLFDNVSVPEKQSVHEAFTFSVFSSKNPEEAELEDTLNQVMVVFKYIEDKDVFQKFYSKMLAKRLVQHMSASDDAEASMISKLKVHRYRQPLFPA